MKCPYRKITERLDSGAGFDTHEYFAECYKEECPFYQPSSKFGAAVIPEYCGKAQVEMLTK